jgi:hypothetical protein
MMRRTAGHFHLTCWDCSVFHPELGLLGHLLASTATVEGVGEVMSAMDTG